MAPWAVAFLTALGLTLIAVPLLRKLALATDFVDRPEDRKSHTRPIPYLGGVALIASVLLAILLQRRLPDRIGGLAFGAALIGTLGLIDDDRNLAPGLRFLAETVAAVVAVALGLRIHATGVGALDIVLTVVWIVGMTNAMNLLDNMDGLAGGVGAAASASLLWLALAQGQEVTATVAAALAGACLGFLVYNRRPASVFMGDAGSLFLGFVLGVLTVDVSPALSPPASFAIPLLLMSLPILDTATVTLARLRRGRPISQGGKDHLSHRLVARGMSPGGAVLVLVGATAFVGGVAVLAGLRVIPVSWAFALGGGCLFPLWVYAARAEVYPEPVVGLPRRLRLALLAIGATGIVMVSPALLALALAAGPAHRGTSHVDQAFASLQAGRTDEVVRHLQQAHLAFAQAGSRLRLPGASAALVVPGLSPNLEAARALADTGRDLTAHGAEIASLAAAGRIALAPSSSPLPEVDRFAPVLRDAASTLRAGEQRLEAILTKPYLVPELRHTATRLVTGVRRTHPGVEAGATTAALLPHLLGRPEERRYLLTLQADPALVPAGAPVTAWAVLVADEGVLRLDAQGAGAPPGTATGRGDERPPPDFPTAAQLARQQYESLTGDRLDGIIAMDATAMSALDRLVDGRAAGSQDQGPDAESALAMWQRAANAHLGTVESFVMVVGEVARRGHLFVALTSPDEQRLASRLGIDGALPPANRDSLVVLTQSAPNGQTAGPLRRHIQYSVRLEPGGDTATLSGHLEVALAGNEGGRAPDATTRVSVVSPYAPRETTIDGAETSAVAEQAMGRWVGSLAVPVPSEHERVVRMDLAGNVRLGPDDWYRLQLSRQPALPADAFQVTVEVPKGWRIAEARGAEVVGSRLAWASLDDERQRDVEVRLERSGWAGVWHRLFHGATTAKD